MFARSAMSEPTATLSPRWTASASRASAPKTDPPSIADKLRIRSAVRLIGAPPSQSQVTDETGFAVLHHGCIRQSSGAVAISFETYLARCAGWFSVTNLPSPIPTEPLTCASHSPCIPRPHRRLPLDLLIG